MKRTREDLLETRLASARTAEIMLLNQIIDLKRRIAELEKQASSHEFDRTEITSIIDTADIHVRSDK